MAHVKNNSGNNEWYTPSHFIESARKVMGRIDLDPATSEIANKTVRASNFFTSEIDGLVQSWHGRVWMNPPYSQPLILQFITAMVSKFEAGEIEQGMCLVNNGTETKWGQLLIGSATSVCFTAKRIRFLDPDGNPWGTPLQGQMIAYFGDNTEAFHKEFRKYGIVLNNVYKGEIDEFE